MGKKKPEVMVSGCFDLLHSGHVAFLRETAQYGSLLVAIGADRTVTALKGRAPMCPEQERLFMVESLACVDAAFISKGSGLLDFESELRERMPAMFVVNEDGDHPSKRALCTELGIAYRVLKRQPYQGLPMRSSSLLRKSSEIPYRIDLAGGWLDQPFVSSLSPGPVITISLEPTAEFNRRSGLATSTRETASRLWGERLPALDPIETARILFACENPPGTKEVSGSQDALGITLAGIARLDYASEYWPQKITRCLDSQTIDWLENCIRILPLEPREEQFEVLAETNITEGLARELAKAADDCWEAIERRDVQSFGAAVTASFEAQIAMFPHMVTTAVIEAMNSIAKFSLGAKLAGAGGGGYIVYVQPPSQDAFTKNTSIPGAETIRIRRL